ncbi:hypothetical protein DQ04_18851010 [Trypanosoma grayi]|uniref:hypothetical protein n=1 Tax=Trypanosoma grayi TaxID=71804 RepID=UPI0004F3F7CB|nr:hypothetical protein DQ04_18851010 [Trypanosoma grayi]KEG05738.1 hypothetical protein DQ04_18851010 [Trypanosoma grayi]
MSSDLFSFVSTFLLVCHTVVTPTCAEFFFSYLFLLHCRPNRGLGVAPQRPYRHSTECCAAMEVSTINWVCLGRVVSSAVSRPFTSFVSLSFVFLRCVSADGGRLWRFAPAARRCCLPCAGLFVPE